MLFFLLAPSKGVENVRIVPITTTSVHIQWKPISEEYWSGDYETGGYIILFQPVSDYAISLQLSPKQQVRGIMVNNNSKKLNYS